MTKLFEFEKDKCCYYNCDEESIKAHSVSEKISLLKISENNHLLHFSPKQINKYLKKEHFKLISTRKSTISKSFCKKHDDVFERLDKNEINTLNDVLLQSYRMVSILLNQERTSCISLYKYNELANYKKISKDNVIDFLKKEKYNDLLKDLNEEIIEIVKKKIFFEMGEKIDSDLAVIENFSMYLIHLIKLYELEEDKNIEVNKFYAFSTKNMEYSFFFYKTNFQIPVALNTSRKLVIENKSLNYYFNIIPYVNSNIIIGVIPKKLVEYDSIVDKIEQSFTDKLSVLNFVEALIVSNDDWYMTPSIINSMSEEKRNIFMQDCMFNNERKFYEKYDLSIFDDLRKSICLELDKTNELEKVDFIPKREEYEKRYINMLEHVNKASVLNSI